MTVLKKWLTAFRLLMKVILPVCLIIAGVAGWNYFHSQELRMKKKPPEKKAAAVETVVLQPGNYQCSVQVMGTVIPDKEIVLKSNVSGEVVSVSDKFVIGGLLKKGETLLTIDDSDYQIEVQKAKSALAKALSELAIEKGSQFIAKEELKLINEATSEVVKATDLALRKPQLIQAEAAVASAAADLEKANLDLSRTKITVPFNALVLEQHVNSGSLVSIQGSLATLVDVDTYWVEAQVPPDRLTAIRMGRVSGSSATIYSRYSNQTWQGRVIRTTGKMTGKSRMAGVIISVPDPLGLKKGSEKGSKNNKIQAQLLLDDYVDIKIMGEIFENVFSIPRSILRDGNTLWLYKSGVLEIKKVIPAWKEDGVVYIREGITSGDIVITSNLSAPVAGMALQQASGDHP